MEFIDIKTTVRTTTGNGPAKSLRREGRVPAVLYGPNTDPILLSVDAKALEQTIKNRQISQVFLNLEIQNGETQTKAALIKELQVHPLSGNFLHIDFYEIAMDRKIKVNVPVTTRGVPKGVELGGMLQVVRRELEVMCLPMEVPEVIDIDVSDLDIGDSIHVEEIPLEGNVEMTAEVNFTVLTILSPKVEEAEEEEAEEEEGEGTETEAEEGEATEGEAS